MLLSATAEATAPCPKCRSDMALAVVIPHPVTPQLAKHTYLCVRCNQTKTYILPTAPSAQAETDHMASADNSGTPDDRRADARETLAAPGTLYDGQGNFLLPCTIRDLSRSGGRLELFKDAALPRYFYLSMMPDGSVRRLCSKVWQLAAVAGVRFVEKQAA